MPDLSPDNPYAALVPSDAPLTPAPQLSADNPYAALMGDMPPERQATEKYAKEQFEVPKYLNNMIASEQTWNSVAPKLKEQFGVDPKDYEQGLSLIHI